MTAFNSGGDFFEGVEVNETFELEFRPIASLSTLEAPLSTLTPMMLTLVLDLYFRLTPNTMVSETPEVQDLAHLMRIPTPLVVDILEIFQYCDPYLNRHDVTFSPLMLPCQQVWQRYGNGDTRQLADYAEQLKAYFR